MLPGVDKCGKIELFYSGGRRALLSFNGDHNGSTGAAVVGETGRLELPRFFWSATEMVLPDGEVERHPLEGGAPREFNFVNSQGFAYEIEHVRKCLEQGEEEGEKRRSKGTFVTFSCRSDGEPADAAR